MFCDSKKKPKKNKKKTAKKQEKNQKKTTKKNRKKTNFRKRQICLIPFSVFLEFIFIFSFFFTHFHFQHVTVFLCVSTLTPKFLLHLHFCRAPVIFVVLSCHVDSFYSVFFHFLSFLAFFFTVVFIQVA